MAHFFLLQPAALSSDIAALNNSLVSQTASTQQRLMEDMTSIAGLQQTTASVSLVGYLSVGSGLHERIQVFFLLQLLPCQYIMYLCVQCVFSGRFTMHCTCRHALLENELYASDELLLRRWTSAGGGWCPVASLQ